MWTRAGGGGGHGAKSEGEGVQWLGFLCVDEDVLWDRFGEEMVEGGSRSASTLLVILRCMEWNDMYATIFFPSHLMRGTRCCGRQLRVMKT